MLRLLLLVAAWQGPIPWCHSHADLITQQPSPRLVDHLRLYHGVGELGRGEFFGWHVHADFPRPPVENGDPSRGESPLEFPVNLAAVDRAIGGDHSERPADWAAAELAATRCDRTAAGFGCSLPPRPRRFFDSYAPSLPLPLRFSILRC